MLKTVATGGGGGSGTVSNVATGTGLTGGPITTTGTISIANTTVTAGTYGNASTVSQVTINAQGQVTNAANVAINIAVANVSGAVPNTVNVLAGGLLSGGGALTGNVTLSLASVPSANVTGLGTMATQNANAVVITGGTINSTTQTTGKYTNANVTSVAVTFPNSFLANSTTTLGNTALTLGGTTSSVGNVTLTNVTIGSGNVNVTSTTVAATTNANATFATSSLLLIPQGFINVRLNGTVVRVPYYAT